MYSSTLLRCCTIGGALALMLAGCSAPARDATLSAAAVTAIPSAQWVPSTCMFPPLQAGATLGGDVDAFYSQSYLFPNVATLASQGITLRFRADYPHARYFSYQSQDVDLGNSLDDVRDDQLVPAPPSFNPFLDGASRDFGPEVYELVVRFDAAPAQREQNTLYMGNAGQDDHGNIMYRVYSLDEGHSAHELSLPAVAAFANGVAVDPCSLVQQPAPTTTPPPTTTRAPTATQGETLSWTSGQPAEKATDGANLDATYVTTALPKLADPTMLVVVQYTIPTFSDTYVGDSIDDADSQVRYSSLSFFQFSQAFSKTYSSMTDGLIGSGANRLTTIVYGTEAALATPAVAARTAALAANTYALDDYVAQGQSPTARLTMRYLLPNVSLPGPGPLHAQIESTQMVVRDAALQTILGPSYPRAILCTAQSFADGSCSWNAYGNLIHNGSFESGGGLDGWTSWCAPNSAHAACTFARSATHVDGSYGLSLSNTTVSYPNSDGNGSAYVSQPLPAVVHGGQSYTISFFASSATAGTALWYGLDLDGGTYTWLPGAACILSGGGAWQKCQANIVIPAGFEGDAMRVNIGVVAPSNVSAVIDDVHVVPGPATPPGAACAAKYDFSAVNAALDGILTQDKITGISLGAYTADCGPIFAGARGDLAEDAVVKLASASKVPSVTAILTLVHAGLIALDDPVSDYLSYWPADKAAITLRMLLSHTSGLPSDVRCLDDSAITLDECARAIAGETLLAAPGTSFIYGGADFQVAGRVAEVVSGQAWNDFFASALAQPCGLTSLSFLPSSINDLGSATNPRIAGGAASNNQDYGKLLVMHLNGGQCSGQTILGPSEVAAMQADQFVLLQQQTGVAVTIGQSPFRDGRHYGLGWWIDPPGAGVYSDLGKFGSDPWIDVQRRYAGVFLINDKTYTGEKILSQVEPLFDQQLDAHGP